MLVAKHGDRAVQKIASAERFLLDSGAWVKPVRKNHGYTVLDIQQDGPTIRYLIQR